MTEAEEHLTWCKKRALELLDSEGMQAASGSMISDLRKNDETARQILTVAYITESVNLVLADDLDGLRDWIEGASLRPRR